MNAIGLVEVIGYVAAIEAGDVCVKSANVNLVSIEKVGSGIVTLTISGDVGAVKSAVEAAEVAVERIGTLRSTHVIPRIHKEVSDILFKKDTKENEVSDTKDKKNTEDEVSITKETKEIIEDEVCITKGIKEIIEEAGEEINNIDEVNKIDKKNEKNTNINKENLFKMSVKDLKILAKNLNPSLTYKNLNSLKKEDLVDLIKELSGEDR